MRHGLPPPGIETTGVAVARTSEPARIGRRGPLRLAARHCPAKGGSLARRADPAGSAAVGHVSPAPEESSRSYLVFMSASGVPSTSTVSVVQRRLRGTDLATTVY